MTNEKPAESTRGAFLSRRRKTLVASALALAVAGAIGGEALTSSITPARAEFERDPAAGGSGAPELRRRRRPGEARRRQRAREERGGRGDG